MEITDEMIRNIQDDMQAIDPDGARREYEKARRWNDYMWRYRRGIHKPPDDVVAVCDNKKNIDT